MDEFKIIKLLIEYFGETGALIVFLGLIAYGIAKFYIARKQAEVIERIEQYLKVLSQKYSDTITFEQTEIVLKDVYCNASCSLLNEIREIATANNIDRDWKAIIAKVKDLIDIRYAEDFSKLTKFVFNDLCLAQVMENKRRDYIYDGLVNILEKHQTCDVPKQSYSFLRNSFMLFYNEDINKIDKRRKHGKD
jgi:hypothetical protein